MSRVCCLGLLGRFLRFGLWIGLFACDSGSSTEPLYLNPRVPIERRVEDLLDRMTLDEKFGQINWPCVCVSELGKDIQNKMDSCRNFVAGDLVTGLGPGGGFFTLANTILHEGSEQQVTFFNEPANCFGASPSRNSPDAG